MVMPIFCIQSVFEMVRIIRRQGLTYMTFNQKLKPTLKVGPLTKMATEVQVRKGRIFRIIKRQSLTHVTFEKQIELKNKSINSLMSL